MNLEKIINEKETNSNLNIALSIIVRIDNNKSYS